MEFEKPAVPYVLPKKDEEDGNAFVIMAQWRQKAVEAGWIQDEIDLVLKEAQSGNYDNLRRTIARFSQIKANRR